MVRAMKPRAAIPLMIFVLAGPAAAQTAQIPPAKPLASIDATLTGQPLTASPAPLQVRVSEVTVPAGASLPAHSHGYLRIVEILSGELKVSFPDGGADRIVHAGDWVADATAAWHTATAIGPDAVVMRVIDVTPPGAAATVMRPATP
jgi:quercetin dioxygenase-like cupin family protein